MNAPRTSIITVAFNSQRHLERCWNPSRYDGAEWIVIDNASTDSSADVAEARGARVIRLTRNVGFAAANNEAAKVAAGEALLFCNPDVTVSPSGIRRLTSISIDAQAIIAPQLMNLDRTMQENGRGMPYPYRKVRHMLQRKTSNDAYSRLAPPDKLLQVSWIMGAALCIPRNVFNLIGGWDAKYFIYYEDADLCLRALKYGIPTFVDGQTNWVHEWARATARGVSLPAWKHEVRSGLRFYLTHTQCILPIGRTGSYLRDLDHSRPIHAPQ